MKSLVAILCLTIAAPLGAATAKSVDPKPAIRIERKVTLAIKDGDVRDVLQTLKTQCRVKNLIIDPNVKGKTGSVFVKDIPCSAAFRLVLRMSGLDARIYENSVVHVSVPGGAAKR